MTDSITELSEYIQKELPHFQLGEIVLLKKYNKIDCITGCRFVKYPNGLNGWLYLTAHNNWEIESNLSKLK